jgi:hypothetical protein
LLGSPATFHKVEKPWGNYEQYIGLDTAARVERGKEVLEPEAGRSCSFHVNSAQALGRR